MSISKKPGQIRDLPVYFPIQTDLQEVLPKRIFYHVGILDSENISTEWFLVTGLLTEAEDT